MRIAKSIKKALILSLVLTPIALQCAPSDANAVRLLGGRPTAIQDVWYSDSVSSYGYVAALDEARFRWNDTSSKVKITRVISSAGTPDKYYVGVSEIRTRWGLQTPYKLSSGSYITASNNETWAFSTMSIYYNNMFLDNFSPEEVISNAGHEFGHSIGLGETPPSGPSSLMKQGVQSIGPTSYDISEIRLKRGN
ncbi:hypothetical protein [Saccharibacillus sacchari]|uniref:Uncharacterized protein n=1 Tax=Saccharibacillus sacchari TaxID=456493 RepID=A0ACC6PG10_9BACL